MNSDVSVITTPEKLKARRVALAKKVSADRPPPRWMQKKLSLLNPTQLACASDHFVLLPNIVRQNPLGEFADLDNWFDGLSPDQEAQVIKLYNVLLVDDFGVILTKYSPEGHKNGYRFEIAF